MIRMLMAFLVMLLVLQSSPSMAGATDENLTKKENSEIYKKEKTY